MLLLFSISVAVLKRALIRLTVRSFRNRLSMCESASFILGFEGGMFLDHCLSFNLAPQTWMSMAEI